MSEPIFKACTRPAMLLSVPMTPLLVVNCVIVLVSMWANFFGFGIWGILIIFPVYFIMRGITKFDDNMFSLLWLKLLCRRTNTNRSFYNAAVYCPLPFKKRG
jgi:type IV secretion system protein VirB3